MKQHFSTKRLLATLLMSFIGLTTLIGCSDDGDSSAAVNNGYYLDHYGQCVNQHGQPAPNQTYCSGNYGGNNGYYMNQFGQCVNQYGQPAPSPSYCQQQGGNNGYFMNQFGQCVNQYGQPAPSPSYCQQQGGNSCQSGYVNVPGWGCLPSCNNLPPNYVGYCAN